jgi:Ni,Fe-hydrogenase I small subunit
MSYSYKELEESALAAIEEHGLWTIQQAVACMACSSSTFYDYGLEKSEPIKAALTKSKTKEFIDAFKRMKLNESASAQIATCKVLGDDSVRDALNGKIEEKEVREVRVTIERQPIRSRDDISNS